MEDHTLQITCALEADQVGLIYSHGANQRQTVGVADKTGARAGEGTREFRRLVR